MAASVCSILKGKNDVKPLACLLVVFSWVLPMWAAKKATVEELKQLLVSSQEARKSDEEVASALREMVLSEELTGSAMNSLLSIVPGRLSLEQIYVLEAESSDLPPPASDLPSTPAPDDAALKAILARAESYIANSYEKLPPLTATKTTLRFQDNMTAVAQSSGLQGSAKDGSTDNGLSETASFVHYINSSMAAVWIDHGAERLAARKDRTPWGANKMIALEEPDPDLDKVFREAQSAGTIRWLRWELVNGRQSAVFSFAVPEKISRLGMDICCFPRLNQTGIATFYTATTGAALAGSEAGPGGGATGNFQTNTDWHDFKATTPYRGELFIDAATGTVLRMITQAELKPAEVVHQEDKRVDYGSVNIGGRSFFVPVKTIIDTEVVPNGDSGAGQYTTRRTLFTSEFKDYQPGR